MNRTTLTIPLILLLAACNDADDGQASVGTSASSTVEATTTAAPTTAAPTTAAPTTAAPTTAAPTTVALTPAEAVAFSTSGQQVTPITFADPALGGGIIYSNASGDAEGALTSVLASMSGTSVALVWFEGTVADCGQGGMAMRIATRPDGALGWEVVPGLGTGDLATLTGSGVESPPNFTGTVRCDGGADPMVFSSTLLEPMAATGTEGGVPAHTTIESTDFPVAMNPAQQSAAKMRLTETVTDVWTTPSIYIEQPEGTPVRNTMAQLVTYDGMCGTPTITRVFMEDVLFPNFRGAWDIAPNLNNGIRGGGSFDSVQNVGRVACT